MRVPLALHIMTAAIPGFIRLGPLHLPVFGMVATAGLIAALALSQRTAQRAGLHAGRLWDVGIVAIVSAFLASRLLLVAANFRLFAAHPVLVLAQPSLTPGGLAVTAGIICFWLRRRHMPLLRVLDAWAAPAALLTAILQLGHFLEGTDAGMPTTLPWGVHTPGDLTFARVHPAQLYAAAGYVLLCVWLLRLRPDNARRKKRSTPEGHGLSRAVRVAGKSAASAAEVSPSGPIPPGPAAALGLILGGAFSFLLSFLRQPSDVLGDAWLDPGQYAAVAAIVAGAMLSAGTASQRALTAATPSLPLAEESR